MNLNENQKNQVAQWIKEGKSLADVQKLLKKEFGLGATYMEVRFLVDDLNLDLKQESEPEEKTEEEVEDNSDVARDPDEILGAPGAVKVSLEPIARPGAIVSGEVTFSDGQKGSWQLDQMGRVGLSPAQEGYKPTQEDLQEFQAALQGKLQQAGF